MEISSIDLFRSYYKNGVNKKVAENLCLFGRMVGDGTVFKEG